MRQIFIFFVIAASITMAAASGSRSKRKRNAKNLIHAQLMVYNILAENKTLGPTLALVTKGNLFPRDGYPQVIFKDDEVTLPGLSHPLKIISYEKSQLNLKGFLIDIGKLTSTTQLIDRIKYILSKKNSAANFLFPNAEAEGDLVKPEVVATVAVAMTHSTCDKEGQDTETCPASILTALLLGISETYANTAYLLKLGLQDLFGKSNSKIHLRGLDCINGKLIGTTTRGPKIEIEAFAEIPNLNTNPEFLKAYLEDCESSKRDRAVTNAMRSNLELTPARRKPTKTTDYRK